MQAIKNILNFVRSYAGIAAMVGIGYLIWQTTSGAGNRKIGYVRSDKLFENFAGIKEAEIQLQLKFAEKQANLDTLKAQFDRDLRQLSIDKPTLSKEIFGRKEDSLRLRQSQIVNYAGSLAKESEEQEGEIMEGVVNQINSFVKQYGDDHGYAMIYGTTSDGNILYGDKALDITDDLIKQINDQYYGKME